MNHNTPHSEEEAIPIIDIAGGYPGEGASFEQAKFKEYSDGSVFMVWDQPGQTVELAAVPRESTREGWCTAESAYGVTMPDIFDVNSGDQESIAAVETGSGRWLVFQGGRLRVFEGRQVIRDYRSADYFTAEHPTIGGTWVLPRRDGGDPIHAKDIRSIGVEATSRLSHSGSNNFELFPAFSSRDIIAGSSIVKQLSRTK